MQKRYELKKHYYPNGKDHTKLTDYDRQVIKEAWENHDEKTIKMCNDYKVVEKI